MRKLGIVVLLVVCLVGTVPVKATEDGERVGWWDGVVEWVVDLVVCGDGTACGADADSDTGSGAEPNGLSESQGDTSAGSEPNG